ncbi:MAG: SDR family NAD(P)-dependent oxidoreductase, partial [Rhodomicrobium sp.]|nr:SDR family NAD(P)-dependent oxidoreductase [Rhodomicrobium sp.]
ILVAGGAGGLGAPLAKALAQRGARLVIADLDRERAAETAAALEKQGGTAIAAALDVVDGGLMRRGHRQNRHRLRTY